jgi:hypothetical protein
MRFIISFRALLRWSHRGSGGVRRGLTALGARGPHIPFVDSRATVSGLCYHGSRGRHRGMLAYCSCSRARETPSLSRTGLRTGDPSARRSRCRRSGRRIPGYFGRPDAGWPTGRWLADRTLVGRPVWDESAAVAWAWSPVRVTIGRAVKVARRRYGRWRSRCRCRLVTVSSTAHGSYCVALAPGVRPSIRLPAGEFVVPCFPMIKCMPLYRIGCHAADGTTSVRASLTTRNGAIRTRRR